MVYSPQIITNTEEVRDFFNPRLSEEEYPEQQLLAKVKAVEYHVNVKYGVSLTNPSTADIEAVKMLIAARIGSEPKVVQRRVSLSREAWVTEKHASEGHDPYSIAQGWEKDAIDILRGHLPDRRAYKVVNG
jgi:hypothetical protein